MKSPTLCDDDALLCCLYDDRIACVRLLLIPFIISVDDDHSLRRVYSLCVCVCVCVYGTEHGLRAIRVKDPVTG